MEKHTIENTKLYLMFYLYNIYTYIMYSNRKPAEGDREQVVLRFFLMLNFVLSLWSLVTTVNCNRVTCSQSDPKHPKV